MPLDLQRIAAQCPGNPIHYFARIDSTMREAAQLAHDGAPHGTVVLADEQTAGIGRLGRTWHSEPETGIYCSLLLRLPLPPDQLPVVTLLLGLAAAGSIQNVTNFRCDLRWPNDVLIRERKIAGILAQVNEGCVVAGIGINVNQTQLPADFRTAATSLFIESGGKLQSREAILSAFLAQVDSFVSLLGASGPDAILRAFSEASSYVNGRRVTVEETGQKGTTGGLDANGFLLVRSDSGKIERVASGGIRPEV